MLLRIIIVQIKYTDTNTKSLWDNLNIIFDNWIYMFKKELMIIWNKYLLLILEDMNDTIVFIVHIVLNFFLVERKNYCR
jgi:hypothetical protein